MKKFVLLTFILTLFSGPVLAEKRFVTDRILLGIHTDPDEKSMLVQSVPSGTELEVIETQEGFVKVRLNDGTEGWVNSGFVMKSEPSTRKLDMLQAEYAKDKEELESIKDTLAKRERELQVRRDELSNAKTTIKELQKNNGAATGAVVDPEVEKKLEAATGENEQLKAKIAELEKAAAAVSVAPDQQKMLEELKTAREENDKYKQRIEIAMAHLGGSQIPTPEELASISPRFPAWYWGLLVIVLIVGVIGGIFWMDYRLRLRHGGFRI